MGSQNCQNNFAAILGWNVTADAWLPYQQPGVSGTLGLGFSSPLWTSSTPTLLGNQATAFTFYLGPVTNW